MKHDYAISFVRFISTLLILCCHIFEWIGYALGQSEKLGILGNYCAVGVQVFLILSGYLYGNRKGIFIEESRIEFLLRNYKKILLDYYVYAMLVIIPVYALMKPEAVNVKSVLGLLTCSAVWGGVHHLWFIPYILVCYLFTPLLLDYKKYILCKEDGWFRRIFVLLITMFIVEMLGRLFRSYFIGAWINCYICGLFLPDLLIYLGRKARFRVAVIFLILSTVLNLGKLHVRYQLLPDYPVGWMHEFCTYYINYSRLFFALTIFLCLMILGGSLEKKRALPHFVLDFSDKYSYDIYIVHMIYVKGPLSVLSVTGSYIVNVLIMIVIVIISAWILYKGCNILILVYQKVKPNGGFKTV